MVTDPFGNDTVTYFHERLDDPKDSVVFQGRQYYVHHGETWSNGLSYRTEYYRGSSANPGNLVRSEEQTWEDDVDSAGTVFFNHTGRRRRVIESRVIYHDDGGKTAKTKYEEFDGLGNFRKVTEYGFDGNPYRVRRTDYNCDVRDAGTNQCMEPSSYWCIVGDPNYHCPLSSDHLNNWVLGTSSYSQTEEPDGTILQRSEFTFDGLGDLRARQDLLTIPTTAGFALQPGDPAAGFSPGDVKTELFYEGDAGCSAGGSGYRTGNPCLKTVSDYGNTTGVFQESYTYALGAHLTARQIAGMPWKAENREVDEATGLARRSFDPNGIATTFTYL